MFSSDTFCDWLDAGTNSLSVSGLDVWGGPDWDGSEIGGDGRPCMTGEGGKWDVLGDGVAKKSGGWPLGGTLMWGPCANGGGLKWDVLGGGVAVTILGSLPICDWPICKWRICDGCLCCLDERGLVILDLPRSLSDICKTHKINILKCI